MPTNALMQQCDSRTLRCTLSLVMCVATPHTTSISLPLALEDGNMTWDESGECAGLMIGDEDETSMNDDANAECVAPKFETKLLGCRFIPRMR